MSLNSILATAPLTTTNYVLKATGTTIGNSLIFDNGTNVGIGNTNTSYTLDVSGTGRFTGALTAAGLTLTTSGSTSAIISGTGTNVYSSLSLINTTTGYGYDIGFGGSASIAPNSFYIYGGSSASVKLLIDSTGAATFSSAAGITNGNGLNLRAGGNTASDANVLNFTSLAGTINVSMFSDASSSNTRLKSLGNLSFHTGNIAISADNERMTITSAGDVGIGSTGSSSYKLQISKTLSSATSLLCLDNATNSTNDFGMDFTVLGYLRVGAIRMIYPAANDLSMGFYTYNGAGNVTERMRIFSGTGNVTIGTIYDLDYALNLYSPDLANTKGTLSMRNGANNGGGYYIAFVNNAGGLAGYVSQTSSTTVLYSSTSDYRLKENVLPMQNAIDRILKIKPVTYKWKNTENEYGEGFIAHELQEIVPLAVAGQKDDMNKDGTIKTQGVDYGMLTPLLVAAMQEQQALITSLQEQINELKNK